MGCGESSTNVKEEKNLIFPQYLNPYSYPVIVPNQNPYIGSYKVIWIDPFIENENNADFFKSILQSLNIDLFTNIMEAINFLKIAKFSVVRIILNEEIYSDFLQCYQASILDMCIFPQTTILTNNEENAIQKNKANQIDGNMYYYFGGDFNSSDKIQNILKAQPKPKNEGLEKRKKFDLDTQLTFDPIESKEQLILPLLFKSLIDKTSNDNMYEYTHELFDKYSQQNYTIKMVVDSVNQSISMEKLVKAYAKLYSIESGFYRDINISLRKENIKGSVKTNQLEKFLYFPFIKVLYEGVKLKVLPLASDSMLYRGSQIGKDEIKSLKDKLKGKIEGLPSCIVFSRPFLSFTKDRDVAISFLNNGKANDNLSKVLFVLEKDDSIGYNVSTHCDLENLSFFQNEREVLFFPFSSFEIKDLKERYFGSEAGYEIRLLYLGKYIKDIENDKDLMAKVKNMPESKFKDELIDCGLIEEEKIQNMSVKKLIKNFKKYEKEMDNNNNNNDNNNNKDNNNDDDNINNDDNDKNDNNNNNFINENVHNSLNDLHLINSIVNNDNDNKNIIIAEINISPDEINKKIQIINSFESIKKTWNYEEKQDDYKHMNEKELIKNIEILINGEKIKFSYFYVFKKEGINRIEYLIKNNLTKTNYMFSDCKYFTNLDLSNFKSEDDEDMSYMFFGCSSLNNLNLSNFKTHNVIKMNCMFNGCESLTSLNLSSFNTEYVEDMSFMFCNCKSLTYLNLSNFNTQNVINMSYMFNRCESLESLDLSNFNTQFVEDMSFMFCNCVSLKDLNISNFDTKNVTNMCSMFSFCDSLPKINLTNFKTDKVRNMNNMFYSCMSLK